MTGYVLENIKWGQGAYGTSGGQVTWSFATTAGEIYDFAGQIATPAYQVLVRRAFDAWEAVADIDFVEVADSANSDIRLAWDTIDGPGGVLGEAASSYYLGAVNTYDFSEVRFDIDENWSTQLAYVPTQVSFYAVALHEIGHTLGLGHPADSTTIMYAFQNDRVDLTPPDIAGIQAIYGPADNFGSDVVGTALDDVLDGTPTANRIYGLGGNDILIGHGGDDLLDGGAGIDTAWYWDVRSAYDIDLFAAGGIAVLDRGGAEGRDTLVSIERLDFVDGVLALDLEGNAGQAYRIYQAAFARTPDDAGLGYWIDSMDSGVSLYAVGQGFVASNEFTALYGSGVGSVDFVERLYTNILGRAGETDGIDYWTGEIDSGRADFAQILIGFSESAENKSAFYATNSDGIWYA
jgi:hypothetical protein